MSSVNSEFSEFKFIRNQVLNSLLLFMAIGSLPLLATSLLNFYSSGWKVSMMVDIVGLLILPIIYFFRKQLSYNIKIGYLIIVGYFAAIMILRDYSFLGTGLIILSSITFVSTLFFGMRLGWILMALNVLSISLIGILFQYNFLSYGFNFDTYIHSPLTWIDQVITFLFFIGIVVIASGKIHNALIRLLKQTKTEKEKFKGLFNSIQDAIIIHTPDGKILEVNNSLLEMYGISRSKVFTSWASDFSISLPFREDDAVISQAGSLLTKRQFETKTLRFDNKEEFYIEVMLLPVEFGEQKAILANIRNINQRKLAEEALRQSEEKYRNLIESSPAAIFIVQNRKYLYVNPSGARNLGYQSNELLGKNFDTLIVPEFRKVVEERLVKTLKKEINQPIEIKILKADGVEMWAETVSIPIDYYNAPASLVMGFDITERKRAEALILQKNKEIERRNQEYAVLNQKLKNAKDKAEESDRLKTAFLSNMSHEIRTPMNAILGFSDLLIKTSLTEKKRTEYIEIINSSGNQLLSLINDIIDISKIESNQIIIDDTSQISIQDIFKQLAVIFYEKARSRKVHLEYKVLLHDSQARVYLDEIRLKQILSNLIGNALKFTHSGYVRFSCAVENGELLFIVEDSGIGIEPQLQSIIFERFRQVDGSTTRDYGGTGLGLAISKALVELMDGKIWLSSVPGKGTVFYFTLPFRPMAVINSSLFPTGNESQGS